MDKEFELKKENPWLPCFESTHIAGFQICPKCNGEGFISNPMLTVSNQTCPVCLGGMIINKDTGFPPAGTPV